MRLYKQLMHYFVCFYGILNGVGIKRLGEVLKGKPSLELLVGQELSPVPQPPCFLNLGGFVVRKLFKQFFKDSVIQKLSCAS